MFTQGSGSYDGLCVECLQTDCVEVEKSKQHLCGKCSTALRKDRKDILDQILKGAKYFFVLSLYFPCGNSHKMCQLSNKNHAIVKRPYHSFSNFPVTENGENFGPLELSVLLSVFQMAQLRLGKTFRGKEASQLMTASSKSGHQLDSVNVSQRDSLEYFQP